MTRLAPPYVGMMSATAFVIDVELLGESEARRRVLALWRPTAVLRELPPGRWLLTLPDAVEVRCELAPGLPLTGEGDLLTDDLQSLRVVDPGAWLDLDELAFHALVPVQGPAPRPTRVPPPPTPQMVDLRSVAGLAARRDKAETAIRELAREGSRRTGRGAEARPGRAARGGSGALARALLRSPAAPMIRRRHQRYLQSLTESFERRRFDEALRDAIALGGEQSGFLSLRLPKRRDLVRGPSNHGPGGAGGSIPLGETVRQHLQRLYREAADELEKQSRFEEAAFVLADLMMNVPGAVAMLERHGRHALAADLAEGRRLEADLVVRLLWRAGQRDRAIEVARARGAYAMAIKRLEPLDATAARQLRFAWSEDLVRAGDHLGAVEALWPDASYRPVAAAHVAAGMPLGGPPAARLLAYALALDATEAGRAEALSLVRSSDPTLAAARGSFVRAFAELPSADQAVDRELAGEVVRQIVNRSAVPLGDETRTGRLLNGLRSRVDPVLQADLPNLTSGRRVTRGTGEPFEVDAPDEPGQLAAHDVVPLPDGSLLVALGSHGVRLLTRDGRTRAEWDHPTDRIVIADHSGAAMLASAIGDGGWDMHLLDLGTRRLRPWVPIRAIRFAPSFDGTALTAVDEDGTINFLDVHSSPARTLWREVNDDARAVDLARSPGRLCAVVRHPTSDGSRERLPESWRWELPGMALRERAPFAWTEAQVCLTTRGLVQLDRDESSETSYVLTTDAASARQRRVELVSTSPLSLLTDGSRHAVTSSDSGRTRIALTPRASDEAELVVHFPGEGATGFRTHDHVVAVWDTSGRIVVADLDHRVVLGACRTRL